MATLTITIPDAQAQRVYDAIALQYAWTPATGLTKPQFAKNTVIKFLRDTVAQAEAIVAGRAAEAAATTAVLTDVVLT